MKTNLEPLIDTVKYMKNTLRKAEEYHLKIAKQQECTIDDIVGYVWHEEHWYGLLITTMCDLIDTYIEELYEDYPHHYTIKLRDEIQTAYNKYKAYR